MGFNIKCQFCKINILSGVLYPQIMPQGCNVVVGAQWKALWCSGYHFWTTSFNKVSTLCRFKPCSWRHLWQWSWLEIKCNRLSSVNHSAEAIHHHQIMLKMVEREFLSFYLSLIWKFVCSLQFLKLDYMFLW